MNFVDVCIMLTPSLPQPVKLPGWKVQTYTPANSVFDGPVTNLLSILCIFLRKRERERKEKKKKEKKKKKKTKTLNPFTAPACTICGLKDSPTHLQTAYFQSCNHLSSMLCILMKIVSHNYASAKNKTKKLKVFSEWHAGKHGTESIKFTYCSCVIPTLL